MISVLFVRIAFFLLFSFGFLNSIKVLKFPLHFPWLSVVLTTALAWIVWEKFVRGEADFPLLTGLMFLFQLYADTLGNVFKFYAHFRWYDRFTHTTGGITIGTVVFLLLIYLYEKKKWKLDGIFLIIFALSLTVSILVSWELYEFFIDSQLHRFMITDRYDTDRDLALGSLGALIAITSLYFTFKKKLKFA